MRDKVISLSIFLVFLIFVYRSLILNINTHLPDWLDYAYVNWLIFQSVDKIITLNFSALFNTNAFYPNQYSYFFSDTFLPQAIIATPFYLLFKNYIFAFNLTFLFTLILDYFSAYLFWKQIFRKNFIAIFGGLLIFFSPFFHLENSHFQMISYWPFFFSLYFIFKFDTSKKCHNLILGAIFFAIQFLASVYIFVFLSFALAVYFLIKVFTTERKKLIIKNVFIILIIFIAIDGIFIKGYIDMKNHYNFQRNYNEYIAYSANITDYVFSNHINSALYSTEPFKYWNSLNKNTIWGSAQFPGFLITVLGLIGLLKIRKDKESPKNILSFKKTKLLFFSLIMMGFIFSLGPRLIFNGTYLHLPAPYLIFLTILPLLESIRAVSRWSFLVYFGLIYFSLLTLNGLSKKYNSILICAFFILLLIIEYIPLNLETHQEIYIDSHYEILRNFCYPNKKILLEIPVTHFDLYPKIILNINYLSKVELSSLYHKCYLVNGYSGYDLPELFTLRDNLYQSILDNDPKSFIQIVKISHANFIKLNPEFLPKEVFNALPVFLPKFIMESDIKQIDERIYKLNY